MDFYDFRDRFEAVENDYYYDEKFLRQNEDILTTEAIEKLHNRNVERVVRQCKEIENDVAGEYYGALESLILGDGLCGETNLGRRFCYCGYEDLFNKLSNGGFE